MMIETCVLLQCTVHTSTASGRGKKPRITANPLVQWPHEMITVAT